MANQSQQRIPRFPRHSETVIHRDLDHRPSHLHDQGTKKASHLTVILEFSGYLCRNGFQGAAVIMEADPGDHADGLVDDIRRQTPKKRILAAKAPATHDIMPRIDLGEELGDVSGIALQVSIQADDYLTLRTLDAGRECGMLAIVPCQP